MNSSEIFEHVKMLHDSELYQDLQQLASIFLSITTNVPDGEWLSLSQKYQAMVYYGNALYHQSQYMKAEDIYRKALHIKKALSKAKGKGTTTPTMDVTGEVEVKYKIYQCLIQRKQFKEAMTVLEGISSKQRNAKVNLALAKLYVIAGMDRSAITSYKEVLRECPLALEAMTGLMSLGIKGADVAALVMNVIPHGSYGDWLSTWIKGQAQLSSREYTGAYNTLSTMDRKSCLKDNVYLINSMAEAKFYNGEYTQALQGFERVHLLDSLHVKNMDLYSFLLAKEKKTQKLQRLSQHLMKVSDQLAESWISMGYYCLISRKLPRAIYFAQKANYLDSVSIEAFLLKGSALSEMKKTSEASLHFLEALRMAPHRYEAYTGLIHCYLAAKRNREALSWAGKAIKTLGSSARTLTLYASVLSKEPSMAVKAKPYLEKAMKLDQTYLDAVYIMGEILAKEHEFAKGIELLRSRLQTHNTCKLHQMLADFLSQTHEHQQALDHYSIALSLDPSNTRAKEGLERVEKEGDMELDRTYDLNAEDMDNSDNDGDFDGSDVESMWSENEAF
ncbi:hypothetical protein FSP39_013538 [Pinctada imbricata]|uniref:Anaphase-promoting complex subunit 7 n=1 Tax=Pinctada imbricata TaxID=66713 RepID=A0AA88XG30_PINIB|nr:hypothetical protein FSP39_013538 [Pinctada imbricata]